MQHNETIIEQFYLQAIPFAELPGHSDSMQMLIQLSGVSTADNVLDMAASSLDPPCGLPLSTTHHPRRRVIKLNACFQSLLAGLPAK